MDEQAGSPSSGQIAWSKSTQITRALGLPATSIYGVFHLVRGWKRGEFSADNIQDGLEVVVWLALVVYYPLHAATVWIVHRVKAGLDPNSDAPAIVAPKAVTDTVSVVRRLTR